MNHPRNRWVYVGLFLAWLFAVLMVFYSVQKPLSVENAQATARTLGNLAVALLTWWVAWAWGRRLVCWLGPGDMPTTFLHALALGLGLGGLSLLTLVVGLLGGLSPIVGWAVMALAAIWPAWDLVCLVQKTSLRERTAALARWGERWRALPWPQKALGLYLTFAFSGSLLLALAPPLGWDSLFYHLTGAKWYLAQGRISPLAIDLLPLHYPALVEMLFTWELLLGSEQAAVLMHWGYGVGLVLITAALARRHLGKSTAVWTLALLGSMPMIFALASWAYSDLALATYLMLAMWALLLWWEQQSDGYVLLAGLATGMALGVKYTSAAGAIALGLLVLWWGIHRAHRVGRQLRPLALFGSTAILAAAPWYLKTWAFTGNPFYPFLFGGRGWDAWRAAWWAEAGTGIGLDPMQLLALPLTVTLGIRDVHYYDGRMGPLFLAFLPIVAWALWRVRPRPKALWALLFAGAVQILGWTIGGVWSEALFQSRLLLPALVMLCPVYGWALSQLPSTAGKGFSLHRFVGVAIGLVLLLNLGEQGLELLTRQPLVVVSGRETRQAYLKRNLGSHHEAMQALADHTPPDARLLFLWEPRSYYAPRHVQPDAILDQWPHLVEEHRSADEIADALHGEGITHILWHQQGAEFVRERRGSQVAGDTWETWEELRRCCLEQVWESQEGAYQLYRLQ